MPGHVSVYVKHPCKVILVVGISPPSICQLSPSPARTVCSSAGAVRQALTTNMASSMSRLGLGRLSLINAATKLALNPIR